MWMSRNIYDRNVKYKTDFVFLVKDKCQQCPVWETRRFCSIKVLSYLIIIWFVVRYLLAVAAGSFLGFSYALVDVFHLSAKFRVLRVEVLVSS